jgi:hypothetical protein
MKKRKVSKARTQMSSAEFAFTAKQVYDDLLRQGFTTEQAFQLTRDVVEAIVK